MKLYGELTREDWLRVSHTAEDEVPDAIILHGEDDNVAENIAEWEPVLDSVLARPRWNMVVGLHAGKRIGFANVCWAPMTALIVHRFAAMGTKRFIQTGFCGGVSPALRYGEVLVVTDALSEDGVATAYQPGRELFASTPALVAEAEAALAGRPFRRGRVLSTSTMFLETSAMVRGWAARGCDGVDGETATTLAVAERFGAQAIALLTCSDQLSHGDTIYERPANAAALEDQASELIQTVALALATR